MAEYALLMLVGAIIGMIAPTIMAGKNGECGMDHLSQRRESRV